MPDQSPRPVSLDLLREAEASHSQALSRRTRAGLARRAYAGEDVVGRPPFGFCRLDRRRVVDPIRWPTVLWLFEHALTAPSAAELARGCAARAARSGEDACPSAARIRRILSDPIYVTGNWVVRLGDDFVQMPAVKLTSPVDTQTFLEVQALLRQWSR